MEFLVVKITDNAWSAIVDKCINYDFYHTQSYHLLNPENVSVLFTFKFAGEVLALPLILREIPDSVHLDCTSAYGYCGPISSISIDLIPQHIIVAFRQELLQYFKRHDIVSAFSRLHPLFTSGQFFTDFGLVKDLNKTIAIDLNLTVDEQRKQFRKSNKSELNQLRRKGYEVKEATSKKEIDAFVAIYHETMARVDAKQHYFFDEDYFYSFIESTCFEAKLLVATFENKIIAGAIFTVTNKIMQYHLAGTTQDFIKVTPMKLIIDEARLLANVLGLHYLHLGGGVGGSDEDSLFRFKRGFSNYECQYQVWQIIVDNDIYQQLVNKNNSHDNTGFFPLYRS
jgi:lipid II:glycine glycyltransferase (peptidoglycan interpeptide bridge formation enzyme)